MKKIVNGDVMEYKSVMVRLPVELYEKIKTQKTETGVSISFVFRKAIENYLEK